MITLQDISLRLGSKHLLNQANLNIYTGQKIGIIGRNGCGKTSLFRLLMGELTHDGGELLMPGNLQKSQMRQETQGSAQSALDYVIDGDLQFRKIEARLQAAESLDDHHQMGILHGELELIGGYSITNRAEQLLSGLGFSATEFSKEVSEFSGGWRIRLNLAQALMQESDLLLLDEPTNHLDLEATLWLQQWLQRFEGTLLLISHDRSFLDVVVSHIVGFESASLILYRGNYSDFEIQKAERLAQQQAVYEKQQQRKKEIEDFVRRFRAKATKAKQAQSRLKELDRMSLIAPAHVDSPFQFKFPEPEKLPDSLLACEHIDVGYGEALIEDFSINLGCDSRIGLLGPNGLGKSTLLKTLVGQLQLLGGEISYSDHVKVGYCAQHQIDVLDTSATPLQLIQRLGTGIREQEIRNFLGRFDFQGDRIEETIEHFSGGEKSRLGLALVAWQKPNLLLMDEPTNHLDLEMCHALTIALQEFSGALILVSHDRHLLNNTVDQFLLIKEGKLEYFDGTLVDYEKLLTENSKLSKNIKSRANIDSDNKLDKKESRQQSAILRNQLKPLRSKIKKLEQQLNNKSKRLDEIEVKLLASELYEAEQKSDLNTLLQEQGKLASELEGIEEEWMQLNEQLESGGM
jgi:ATP-binding cassette, subfamily F, member 3